MSLKLAMLKRVFAGVRTEGRPLETGGAGNSKGVGGY